MGTLNESMQDFIGFMKEHSSFDRFTSQAMTKEAHDDIQSDIVDELIDEIESANLITYSAPIEVQLNTDNLREWLKMYYIVEKR